MCVRGRAHGRPTQCARSVGCRDLEGLGHLGIYRIPAGYVSPRSRTWAGRAPSSEETLSEREEEPEEGTDMVSGEVEPSLTHGASGAHFYPRPRCPAPACSNRSASGSGPPRAGLESQASLGEAVLGVAGARVTPRAGREWSHPAAGGRPCVWAPSAGPKPGSATGRSAS